MAWRIRGESGEQKITMGLFGEGPQLAAEKIKSSGIDRRAKRFTRPNRIIDISRKCSSINLTIYRCVANAPLNPAAPRKDRHTMPCRAANRKEQSPKSGCHSSDPGCPPGQNKNLWAPPPDRNCPGGIFGRG